MQVHLSARYRTLDLWFWEIQSLIFLLCSCLFTPSSHVLFVFLVTDSGKKDPSSDNGNENFVYFIFDCISEYGPNIFISMYLFTYVRDVCIHAHKVVSNVFACMCVHVLA
jgi:hypothetical protein